MSRRVKKKRQDLELLTGRQPVQRIPFGRRGKRGLRAVPKHMYRRLGLR